MYVVMKMLKVTRNIPNDCSLTQYTLIVVDKKCSQCVFYSLFSLNKRRVLYVRGIKTNPTPKNSTEPS